jgi:hypothetical protein
MAPGTRVACVILGAVLLVLSLSGPAGAQPAPPPPEIAAALRLASSERPAGAVAALLARLDLEAARTTSGPGAAGALHESLCVLTAHDPFPARSLEADDAWSTSAARRALARAWHEVLDPASSRPFGDLRRAGLASAREGSWGSDPAEQFSLIRRLARARMDRRAVRLTIIELWDLGTEAEPLERARAFGRRRGLYPPTPAEMHEHCRVHCCV